MPGKLIQQISGFTHALIREADHKTDFIPHIKRNARIPPQLALSIYRNNTRGTRIASLEVIYPACRTILGDDTFRAIASDCVTADTAGAADLNRYGRAFDRHLDTILGDGRLPSEYAYLPDLARLEFMIHAACYADPEPEFDFKGFEQGVQQGEEIRFRINPSLGLLATAYPVDEIWRLNQPRSTGPEPGRTIPAIAGKRYLLVLRNEYRPLVTSVSRTEYRLLQAFAANRTLQDAIEHVDGDIDVALPKLIANKYITAAVIGNPGDG